MMTIKQLRELLNELEEDWIFEEMFGKFEDQPVLTDFYREGRSDAVAARWEYTGFGPAKAVPYWELGLCIIADEEA